MFWIVPALAASVLFAARGTYLGSRSGTSQR
jgi:hypothetical protein